MIRFNITKLCLKKSHNGVYRAIFLLINVVFLTKKKNDEMNLTVSAGRIFPTFTIATSHTSILICI